MKGLRRLSSVMETAISLHQGSGDVRDATCQRMFCHRITLAGVLRRLILDRYLEFHLTLVGRHAANIECCQRNAPTLANFYVTLARVLHVRIWVLFRAVFVAKGQHPGDALILITMLGGAAARSVGILCLVVSTIVRVFVTKDCAVPVKLRSTPVAIVEK